MNPVSGAGGAGSINQVMALRQQIIDRSSVLQELHQDKTAAPTETQSATEGARATSLPHTSAAKSPISRRSCSPARRRASHSKQPCKCATNC